MDKLWKCLKWFFRYWYCWVFGTFMATLILAAFISPPTPAYTTRANCTRAMANADKELKEAQQEALDWENSYKELAAKYNNEPKH